MDPTDAYVSVSIIIIIRTSQQTFVSTNNKNKLQPMIQKGEESLCSGLHVNIRRIFKCVDVCSGNVLSLVDRRLFQNVNHV